MTKTDLELYDSMCSGDKSALESIYSKYERLLYSYAYKMTSSHEVSEEIVQDVFTKLWQNKNPYDAIVTQMPDQFMMEMPAEMPNTAMAAPADNNNTLLISIFAGMVLLSAVMITLRIRKLTKASFNSRS